MLREDIMDNRLKGDIRVYDIDVDYCGWDVDMDMVSFAWHWDFCTIVRW